MIRLLRAGFLRYIKNIVFWLSVAVTICLAVFFGINYGSGYSAMAEFVVFAVLLAWVIGREQGDGLFHNKILAGYTRTEIFFSELILGCGACACLFFLFALIYACINACEGYRLEDVPAVTILELLLGSLLANLVMAALLVTLACLISSRYAAVVVCILLTVGMSVLSAQIRKPATTKEYRTETTTAWGKSDGDSYELKVNEQQVYSSAWIGEPAYTVCVFLYNVMPTGQMQEYEEAGGIWTLVDGVRTELYLVGRLIISEEDAEDIRLNLVYALITLPAVCAGGWLGFRRKEFL